MLNLGVILLCFGDITFTGDYSNRPAEWLLELCDNLVGIGQDFEINGVMHVMTASAWSLNRIHPGQRQLYRDAVSTQPPPAWSLTQSPDCQPLLYGH